MGDRTRRNRTSFIAQCKAQDDLFSCFGAVHCATGGRQVKPGGITLTVCTAFFFRDIDNGAVLSAEVTCYRSLKVTSNGMIRQMAYKVNTQKSVISWCHYLRYLTCQCAVVTVSLYLAPCPTRYHSAYLRPSVLLHQLKL